MNEKSPYFLTDAQLAAEIERCEYCAEKPCKEGCPADCSPADFIMAVKVGEKSDYRRAAAVIMGSNPLGGVCGAVCPDRHCMKVCSRSEFDRSINIPAVQATIIQRAKEMGVMPEFEKPRPNGKRLAVVGGGPAGYGAAAVLMQKGYQVDIYEKDDRCGGMCTLIPGCRLDQAVLKSDLEFFRTLGEVAIHQQEVEDPKKLLDKGYDAVIVPTGLSVPIKLGIPGEELVSYGLDFLKNPAAYPAEGKCVAVVGGGGIAADVAEVAAEQGAKQVELFALEKMSELPMTAKELSGLLKLGVHVNGRVRVTSVAKKGKAIAGIKTLKVTLPDGV
ncbi:MAG: FAD-dependent oxidoreductase, partial [Candidatus Riflebacteria bacterium]|nr:FAD-dependent oxidoreductase [Candidatus Riflebacteria bacterium]